MEFPATKSPPSVRRMRRSATSIARGLRKLMAAALCIQRRRSATSAPLADGGGGRQQPWRARRRRMACAEGEKDGGHCGACGKGG